MLERDGWVSARYGNGLVSDYFVLFTALALEATSCLSLLLRCILTFCIRSGV